MEDNLNEIVETVVEEESEVAGTIEADVEANGELDGFADITEVDIDDETNVEETNENVVPPVVEEVVPVVKPSFGDRAVDMGLTVLADGSYKYTDQFSEIIYKNLKTLGESGVVDDEQIPHLAIFTKGLETDSEWKYQNFISDSYKFLGNATLIDQIKGSIVAVGNADLTERNFMTPNNTKVRHEIIINNPSVVPGVGTVSPMMNISNSYDGTGASLIVFGMHIAESDVLASAYCSERFGKIKQIHLTGSSTELSAAFGEYVTIFSDNIVEMINENFTNQITESDMMKILDIIETKAGKKRRELISNELPVTDPDAETPATPVPWSMTSWQLFLTLTRFTSVEENLNSKKIMESVAERVLIVPERMIEALKVING